MPQLGHDRVEVFAYRVRSGRFEVLLLRRGPQVPMAGTWHGVTGFTSPGIQSWQIAARELRTQTGLPVLSLLALPSPLVTYIAHLDQIDHAAAYAARVGRDFAVCLDELHDSALWLGLDAAIDKVHWPSQGRALRELAWVVSVEHRRQRATIPASLYLGKPDRGTLTTAADATDATDAFSPPSSDTEEDLNDCTWPDGGTSSPPPDSDPAWPGDAKEEDTGPPKNIDQGRADKGRADHTRQERNKPATPERWEDDLDRLS